MFGAVGGPQWDALRLAQKPEAGLLRLRKGWTSSPTCAPRICFRRWPTPRR